MSSPTGPEPPASPDARSTDELASRWKIVGASVRGAAHEADATEGQDAHAFATAGPWAIGAVCDGAGSAALGGLGARVGADAVVDALVRACDVAPDGPVAASRAFWTLHVTDAVRRARLAVEQALRNAPGGTDESGAPRIDRAHATLVLAVVHPGGGLFAHVGDGTAVALHGGGVRAQSKPENGAFANETFFFTEPGWKDRLRLTAFSGPVDLVLLMSDGGAALATAPDGAPHAGFVDPVTAYLDGVDAPAGCAALADTLGGPQTHAVTGDDKTIVWMRPPLL